MTLSPQHLQDLQRSGLSDATILAAGVYTAMPPAVPGLLGIDPRSSGLVFPYPGTNGMGPAYVRVKLDQPLPGGAKYLSPKGSTNRLYIPPGFDRAWLADPTVALVVTEGEKKSLKARQEGLACVAVGGVYNWLTKDPAGVSVPIPDLDLVTWRGRTVDIIFDADPKPTTAANVRQATQRLADELSRRGATVFTRRLPLLPDGGKCGLDDFLLTRSLDDLAACPRERLTAPPLGRGLGAFLAQTFPPVTSYIEGILSDEGGGWIGGEEKLGKTYWALTEALALATGETLAGRFKVPETKRVLFLEEEDSPRRCHRRLHALLRGLGWDAEDPALREALDRQFRIEVWAGFTREDPRMMARLEAAIEDFAPDVIYFDVFRKVTLKNFKEQVEMAGLLEVLDDLRRRHGCLIRIVHHYRKNQGFRVGRGSQEI